MTGELLFTLAVAGSSVVAFRALIYARLRLVERTGGPAGPYYCRPRRDGSGDRYCRHHVRLVAPHRPSPVELYDQDIERVR